jgi:hypothetical protein
VTSHLYLRVIWCLPIQGNGISLHEIERDWSKDIIQVLTTWVVWPITTCSTPDCIKVKSKSHQYSILTVKVSIRVFKNRLTNTNTRLIKKLGNTSPYAELHNLNTETFYNWNIPRRRTNDNSFCLKVKLKTEGEKDLHDGLMSVYIYIQWMFL